MGYEKRVAGAVSEEIVVPGAKSAHVGLVKSHVLEVDSPPISVFGNNTRGVYCKIPLWNPRAKDLRRELREAGEEPWGWYYAPGRGLVALQYVIPYRMLKSIRKRYQPREID